MDDMGPVLAELTTRLNAISEDIGTLEKFLSSGGAGQTVSIDVEGTKLSWMHCNGKMRVCVNEKALLEAKVDVRLAMFNHLPALIEAVGIAVAAAIANLDKMGIGKPSLKSVNSSSRSVR